MTHRAPEIEWEDCYPTEDSIEAASRYWQDAKSIEAIASIDRWLRDTLLVCAENCCASAKEETTTDILGKPVTHLHFSTGGWSGAESIVSMIENNWLLKYRMLQWRRGGHYIFEFPKGDALASAPKGGEG